MKKRNYHQWTKSELKSVIKLWDSKTTEELAQNIGVARPMINAIATKLRKAGVKLTRKSRKGYLDSLIKEVAKEV